MNGVLCDKGASLAGSTGRPSLTSFRRRDGSELLDKAYRRAKEAGASKMFEQPIMTREYFDKLADQFRSPHIWMHQNGEWQLRRTVYQPRIP